jgi:hypothetical protein
VNRLYNNRKETNAEENIDEGGRRTAADNFNLPGFTSVGKEAPANKDIKEIAGRDTISAMLVVTSPLNSISGQGCLVPVP